MMTGKYIFFIGMMLLCSTAVVHAQEDLETEFFDVEVALFNGRLKRFFTYDAFQAAFGKADSVHLLMDLQPCSYIFEEEDGSKHADDVYLYKDGSRFEKSQEKVAVDEFRFTKTNFIHYGGILLNEQTSLADLQKLFPRAASQAQRLSVEKEGDLFVLQLAESIDGQSDGQVRLYLKDGRLYYIHWWFPC